MAGKSRFLTPHTNAKEDAMRRVLDTLALVRREPSFSLPKAAKLNGTTVPTIQRLAPQALEKRKGRLVVKSYDLIPRKMLMLTSKGIIEVTTAGSDTASVIGAYWNAVRAYITTGDYEELEPFILRFIHVEEGDFEFLTHRPTLNRLARAGELYFQDLYGKS
jgi:hypothetical protein